jgi:penicillin V acylase-like amidase (Ntn superfamily)
MCTSIYYETKDHTHFLARTLDFAQDMHLTPVIIENGHHFSSQLSPNGIDSMYRFIGAGKNDTFADGFNEKGLAIASLYFNENAVYAKEPKTNAINLAATEVIPWVLGNTASVSEFKKVANQLNICQVENSFVKGVMPLHWILYDRHGDSLVMEITKTGMQLYDDPVGVMTNSPAFPWQLTNLGHYSHIQPQDFSAKKYGDYQIVSDGPGTGAIGLPGDYTSTSRFVRTAFLRQYTDQATDAQSGLATLNHILNNVDIPRGVKVNTKGQADYTQYKGFMDLDHLTYYYLPYSQLKMTETSL